MVLPTCNVCALATIVAATSGGKKIDMQVNGDGNLAGRKGCCCCCASSMICQARDDSAVEVAIELQKFWFPCKFKFNFACFSRFDLDSSRAGEPGQGRNLANKFYCIHDGEGLQ